MLPFAATSSSPFLGRRGRWARAAALLGVVSGLVASGCEVDHRLLFQTRYAARGGDQPSTPGGSGDAGADGIEAGSAGEGDARSGSGGARGKPERADGGQAGSETGGESEDGASAAGGRESGGATVATAGGGASSSGAASSIEGGGLTSTGGAASRAGAGGIDAVSGAPVGGAAPVLCPDLDADGVPDCSETLLKNANFDTSFTGVPSGWQLSTGAIASWDSLDSMSANSGSVLVTTSDGIDTPSLRQCVTLQAGKNYEAYALTLTQASASAGFARMSEVFFPSTDCSGSYDRVVVSGLEGTLNSWRTLHVAATPALSDGSLQIRLEVLKANNAPGISVHFDSVLLSGK